MVCEAVLCPTNTPSPLVSIEVKNAVSVSLYHSFYVYYLFMEIISCYDINMFQVLGPVFLIT